MYQSIPAALPEHSKEIATGYEGENIYRTFVLKSDDDGVTWSVPVDVTRGTKHPEGATTVAAGPGIGIQLTRGAHAGRIAMPFNEGPFWKWQNYAAYSDDRGVTWHCGQNAPGALIADPKFGERSQLNEVQMVELSDGSVRLNSRQFAGEKVRKTAVSQDGGETWSPVQDVPELHDPSCMASIYRYSFDDGPAHKGRILYSGPAGMKRELGVVHLSFDDGATWPVQRQLWSRGFAYSVLTKLADGMIGCLFEIDGTSRIVFARFPIEWVMEKGNGVSVSEETFFTH
jgi:sialidase-1